MRVSVRQASRVTRWRWNCTVKAALYSAQALQRQWGSFAASASVGLAFRPSVSTRHGLQMTCVARRNVRTLLARLNLPAQQNSSSPWPRSTCCNTGHHKRDLRYCR